MKLGSWNVSIVGDCFDRPIPLFFCIDWSLPSDYELYYASMVQTSTVSDAPKDTGDEPTTSSEPRPSAAEEEDAVDDDDEKDDEFIEVYC
jgi:hypothetical protein